MLAITELGGKLLDQTQAAELLCVEPRTLEGWRARRIGPRFIAYSRRCVRYRLSDLQAWLDSKAVAPVGEQG
jgi:hypothetical protein